MSSINYGGSVKFKAEIMLGSTFL